MRIADRNVLERRDYLAGARVWFDGQSQPMALPRSDVVGYELEGQSRIIVRPSGTEPKLKVYFDHRERVGDGEPLALAEERARRVLAELDDAVRVLLHV
jgi:phosphomannomutase